MPTSDMVCIVDVCAESTSTTSRSIARIGVPLFEQDRLAQDARRLRSQRRRSIRPCRRAVEVADLFSAYAARTRVELQN